MSTKKNNESTETTEEIVFEDKVNNQTEDEEQTVETTAIKVIDTAAVDKIIRTNVYASMGTGIVPVPLFSFAAASGININMVRQLSALYNVEFKEDIAKNIITSVLVAGAGVLATPLIETAVIGIPLVGLPFAVATRPVLNGMGTYAVGQMFVTHFNRGGSFVGANIDEMKESFTAAYKNSRVWLGDAIAGKNSKNPEGVSA